MKSLPFTFGFVTISTDQPSFGRLSASPFHNTFAGTIDRGKQRNQGNAGSSRNPIELFRVLTTVEQIASERGRDAWTL